MADRCELNAKTHSTKPYSMEQDEAGSDSGETGPGVGF